jgi:hypothetical protein
MTLVQRCYSARNVSHLPTSQSGAGPGRFERNTVMKASQLPARMSLREMFLIHKAQHWGGLAFVFGNVLFVVNKLDEMSRLFLSRPMPDVISGQNPALILLGQVALTIGYVAYYQFYAPRVGQPGKNALRLLCGGGILLAIGHVSFMSAIVDYVPTSLLPYAENLFLLVIIGLLILLIGLIWFGILNLRQPVLRHWQWLPLATGLMGFIGFFLFSGEEITATFLFFRSLFAFGLIGLGLTLWLEKPIQPDSAAKESSL